MLESFLQIWKYYLFCFYKKKKNPLFYFVLSISVEKEEDNPK